MEILTMHNKRLVNIHKMGTQVSNQHLLIEDMNAAESVITFFSYETPIYEVVVENLEDFDGKAHTISRIRSFEFYNYMRIFFPQFFDKSWDSITLSAMTKRYITFSCNKEKMLKLAFDRERKYIDSLYKEKDPKIMCDMLEYLIENTTGVHYDIATKSIIKKD